MTAHAMLAFATYSCTIGPHPSLQLDLAHGSRSTPRCIAYGLEDDGAGGKSGNVMRYCCERARQGAIDIAAPVVRRAQNKRKHVLGHEDQTQREPREERVAGPTFTHQITVYLRLLRELHT